MLCQISACGLQHRAELPGRRMQSPWGHSGDIHLHNVWGQCRCKLCEQCKLKSCRRKLPNFRRIIETQKSCKCFPFWCSTCHLKIDSLSLGFPVPNPFQIIGNEPCISKVHLFNSFQMILAMSYANASASIPYLSSTTRYKSGSPGNKNAANINSSSCHVTKIYNNRARIVTW